jgi:hypothetical protein
MYSGWTREGEGRSRQRRDVEVSFVVRPLLSLSLYTVASMALLLHFDFSSGSQAYLLFNYAVVLKEATGSPAYLEYCSHMLNRGKEQELGRDEAI